MKKIIFIGYLCIVVLKLQAQVTELKKPSSLVFHTFYNDFKTAQQIKASSFRDVLKNGKWSGFREMQMGFGLNYLKGIRQTIDFVATVDGSSIDYPFKDGTTNGSSKFLLDMNAGLNVKLFNDTHAITPYLFGGIGSSYYTKKVGLYLPVGIGIQVNLFKEAFIITNIQYRFAETNKVSDHFYYTIGIGTSIGKIKQSKPIKKEAVPIAVAAVKPVEVKLVEKDIRVRVVDEQTSMPLPGVNINIISSMINLNAISDINGEVVFKAIKEGEYTVNGQLNEISTNTQNLQQSNFDGDGSITVNLQHNDPRFTLMGMVIDKSTSQPIRDVTVSIINKTNGTTKLVSNNSDGMFSIQLAAASDFSISAKKANYISNIETISTIGLNRTSTLDVKLSLGIEETKQNSTITLKNIYYQTGSATIQQEASSDLNKLILFLNDNPKVKIEIASHTDSRGSASSNFILSQRRAQEVVNFLKNHGVNIQRIIAKGYGETRLINKCGNGIKCTEAQYEQNRRTEFKIISN